MPTQTRSTGMSTDGHQKATTLRPGDWVIYRKQKVSTSPGPRAEATVPAPKGDTYHYVVEKYWLVNGIHADGNLQLVTRRGKTHVVAPNDPRLRRARWWERLLYADRFRSVEASSGNLSTATTR